MTREWHSATLGEVTQFINGLWKGEDPPFVHVGVIRNTNFTKEGDLDDSNIAYLDVEAKKFQKRRLQFGDLILEKSGGGPKQAVGRVVLFDKTEGDFSFSNFTAAIRVVDPTALDAKFLHKYLHWVYVSGRTEAMQSHSTGIRNLNGDAYKAIKVVYPSLPEQRRIVDMLDEAFEGIATAKANAEKNLQNARELFVGHVEKVFGQRGADWHEAPLLSFAIAISTGPFGSLLHKSDYVSEGVPLVNPINIVDGLIVSDPDKQIDPTTKQRLLSYVLREGDVVVGRRGEIGRCAVVGPSEAGWVCGTGCFFIRPLPTVVRSAFIAHLIRSREYRAQLERASTGATMKNLSNTALGDLHVAVPTVGEQDRVLALIEQLSGECGRLEGVYERKLGALDELKKSLLHQAFNGQLTAKTTDKLLAAAA